MRGKYITSALVASALAVAAGVVSNQSNVRAGMASSFFCGESKGAPATMAETSRGDLPVIRWVSDHFDSSGYTPQERCQEVSARFDKFYNNGNLNYLTTGRVNGLPVICAVPSEGASCTSEYVLYTLKPWQSPSSRLQALLAFRSGQGGALNETGDRIYVDMEDYLQNAPVEAGTEPTPTSEPEAENSEETSNNSSSGSVW